MNSYPIFLYKDCIFLAKYYYYVYLLMFIDVYTCRWEESRKILNVNMFEKLWSAELKAMFIYWLNMCTTEMQNIKLYISSAVKILYLNIENSTSSNFFENFLLSIFWIIQTQNIISVKI